MDVELAALVGWLSQAGGEVGGIRVGSAAPRGVVATRDIREGELLLSVPESILLTARGVATNLIAGRWRDVDELNEVDLLCIALLEELELRADSRWAAWLPTLPVTYDVPFLWEEAAAREALRCPILLARVEAEREELTSRFAFIGRLAAERSLPLPRTWEWRLFLWAAATVRTRGATILEEQEDADGTREEGDGPSGGAPHWAICPLGDMFNHTADALTTCRYDRASASYRYVAGAAMRKGDEVFVCYGGHDDGARRCVVASRPRPPAVLSVALVRVLLLAPLATSRFLRRGCCRCAD